MKKIYIYFAVLLILGISAGIYYFTDYRQSKMEFPADISMQNQEGNTYNFREMKPKVRLLEFMYTQCPDICPTTTFEMQKLRDRLAAKNVFGDKIEFITVTINPEKDTEKVLDEYIKTFKINKTEGWDVLRGSSADTQKLANQFNFQYRDNGTGQFVHTSATYLLNQQNAVIKVFGMGKGKFDEDKVYKKIMNELY
ncbi:SCO family protein [Peribacillus sp. SCS-155]|uniref:SCO family protein n=1 Tax=Peribacillus sedimenti TaxID=3115297 RepID=UPI0039066B04